MINSEIKAGRGSPHGGVFLDIATRRPADVIRKRLPSMYHQFMELAGVDITAEAMEVGPTCHYIMGGVRVDVDTEATTTPGLFAAGEVAGGMHGANRLGGNSLSDLLVFGRRAGMGASDYAEQAGSPRGIDSAEVQRIVGEALAPFSRESGESPTRSSTTSKRPCRPSWGSIRTSPSCKKPSWLSTSSTTADRTCLSREEGLTTRGGTPPPTCRRCSPSHGWSRWGRSTARRAAEATRVRRLSGPVPDMGKVNFVQRLRRHRKGR